ncbi:flagellar protein FlgN [Thalassococcus sp. BH17M4-6]|uniref:flagellar protein FlgN n=1 Tax=Thalassococcus sp. BH17M4-6 TaxID=3413148 RepID=UPI003BD9539E
MDEMDTATLLDALSDLVTEERSALLDGRLDALSDLLDRKEALITALAAQDPPDRAELEALQTSMQRNGVLFDQALEGIRNVSKRLGALRQLRKSVDTYDASGRRTAISDPGAQRLERRA